MEQAVNQFTKGLQTDTNPMMQGSDTLSDCLNGTIITMNGNEVALQNDMGNRRIDNAFLPPGYEPVGMKEYGGIIYVAAYNPLTGRGQLGSFPSPERKISFKSPSAQLNLSNHIEEIGENEQKKYIIRKREQLLPLTEDVPLRAGDKFIIKTEGETNIYNYQEYLSNCFPDSTNKKWSLLVGILNSQNQFIDITNSLIRESITPVYIEINGEYDGTKYKLENGEYTIINGEYSGTKYKKVDEGFYIWKDYTEESLQNTISDKELIKERMAKEINSYSYKLVSPLYIKSVLNYPYTVEYEISGEKVGEVASGRFDNSFFEDDENESRADNSVFIDDDDDENQNSEQSQLTPASFPKYNFKVTVTYSHIKDVLLDGIEFYNEDTLIETDPEEPVEFEQEFEQEFDQITGNYITKAIYTYNDVELSGDIFNYSIVPIFKFPFEGPEEQTCYLEEFRYNGQLDLTKLNSDFIELNAWRYYNKLQSKETIFYIEYTAYPKRNSNLENIYIKINNRKFILVDSIKSQGFKTITVPWEEVIEEGKLYEAVLGYSVKGLEQSNSSSNCYFVSTKLFNENFNGTEGNWISGVYNPDIHSNIFIKDFRTIQAVKIVPKINYNIQCIDNADDNISQNIMSDNDSNYKSLISNKTLKHINTLNYNINYDSIFPKEEMPNNAQLSDIRLESLKIGNHTIELKQNAPLQNSNYTSYIMNDGETQMSNNDLLEKSGNYQNIPLEIENSQEKPIIKFIQTKIAQNTGYVSMISEYNITEYIKGLTIHQDIEVTNLITSFKYFINQNGLNTINGPYFNLSHLTAGPDYWCAGTATTSIQTSTLTGNDQSNRLPSNYYSGSYELINEIIQEGHNQDVFIAEFDDADIIKGWSPTSNINLNISRPSNSDSDSPLITTDAKGEPFEDEENDGHGYSRIWLRIDKNRFIPILVYNSTYKSNLPTDYTNDILSVCEHINRYYNYNITPKSFTKYILDINNCIKTKEFDLEVQYKINYNLGTLANYNNKFFIWVPERKEDVLYENNIKSLSFEKEIEFLTTKVINCALLSDAGNLCLKDSTGQNFDSSYCYCKDSQLETYYKTYMPKQKVTLGEHLYLPNLINLEKPQGTSEFKVTSVVDNSPKVFVSARASMVQQANDRSYLNSHSYFFFDSLPAL